MLPLMADQISVAVGRSLRGPKATTVGTLRGPYQGPVIGVDRLVTLRPKGWLDLGRAPCVLASRLLPSKLASVLK